MLRVVLLIAAGVLASGPAEAQTIMTVAGKSTSFGLVCGDGGPATKACLNGPSDVAVDEAGNLFIADKYNDRIRKVDASGTITTVAGNGLTGYCGDGGPATSACLASPSGIALDAVGNLFISTGNRIRKVDTTGTITTVAGNTTGGYCGDGGPATSACLNGAEGVAVDVAGNLFIADAWNHRIRKVNTTGTITTVAGNGTSAYCGDGGPATSACLSAPYGVAVDEGGNLFVADAQNHRIRKVNTTGTITTVAGSGTGDYCGDGAPATSACLYYPERLALDAAGNVFIADFGNSRIRKVETGTITTVAGNGVFGYCGDGGPATSACLASPRGIALDAAGALYVADTRNIRIRKVDIAFLTLSTPSLSGCLRTTGRVTLGAPAPIGGTLVTLSSDNVNAMAPANMTITAGNLARSFAITTTAVSSVEIATITAEGPEWTRSVGLRLKPMEPKKLTLSPNPVAGGTPVVGTITLECAAGPGDIVVTLTSSEPAIAMPATTTATVPFGMKAAPFTVTTVPVAKVTTPKIKATANGVTKAKPLKVNPGS